MTVCQVRAEILPWAQLQDLQSGQDRVVGNMVAWNIKRHLVATLNMSYYVLPLLVLLLSEYIFYIRIILRIEYYFHAFFWFKELTHLFSISKDGMVASQICPHAGRQAPDAYRRLTSGKSFKAPSPGIQQIAVQQSEQSDEHRYPRELGEFINHGENMVIFQLLCWKHLFNFPPKNPYHICTYIAPKAKKRSWFISFWKGTYFLQTTYGHMVQPCITQFSLAFCSMFLALFRLAVPAPRRQDAMERLRQCKRKTKRGTLWDTAAGGKARYIIGCIMVTFNHI